MPKKREDTGPEPAHSTRRQRIVEVLGHGPIGFEELRRELGLGVRELDSDLHHVARSLERAGRELVVTPAECLSCGFVFEGRSPRRFHAPSRCPACRGERTSDPLLALAPEGAA
jgi:predicted Zn-ribbon and HTH transcriptional regulator